MKHCKMKITLVLITSFFVLNVAAQSDAQVPQFCDSVIMNDGSVKLVNVQELTRNKVIYFLCCEDCAVPRELKIKDVDTVIFNPEKKIPEEPKIVEPSPFLAESDTFKKNPIKRYSFYLEGTLPFGAWDYTTEDSYPGGVSNYGHQYTTIGIGISVGNKWYFSKNERYKTGIIVNYARAEFTTQVWYLDPLHIGWANAWKRKNGSIAEFNLSVGPRLNFDNISEVGFAISPELKFRVKGALFGIAYDYGRKVYSSSYYPGYSMTNTTNSHMLRFSAGFFK